MHLSPMRQGDKGAPRWDDDTLIDQQLRQTRQKLHTWAASSTDGTREESVEDTETGDNHERDKPAFGEPAKRHHSVSSNPSEELDGALPSGTWGSSASEEYKGFGRSYSDFHGDVNKKLAQREGEKRKQTVSPMSRPSIKILATALERAKHSNARERGQECKSDPRVHTEGLRDSSPVVSAPSTSLPGSLNRVFSPKARDTLGPRSPTARDRSRTCGQYTFSREEAALHMDGRRRSLSFSRTASEGASQKIDAESVRRKLKDLSPRTSLSPRFSERHGPPPQFGSRMPDSKDKFDRSFCLPNSSKRLEIPATVGNYYDSALASCNANDSEVKVAAAFQSHYMMDADSDDEVPMSASNSMTDRRFSGLSEWLAFDNPHKEVEAYRQRLHQAEQELQQVAEVGQMLLNRNQELEGLLQDMTTKSQTNDVIEFWKRKVEYLEQELAYQCQQLASAQEVELVLREKMQELEAEVQDLRADTFRHNRRPSWTEDVDSSRISTKQSEQAIREVASHNQALEEEVCRLEMVVRDQKSREMELEAKIEEHERRLAMEQLEEQAQIDRQMAFEDLGVFL